MQRGWSIVLICLKVLLLFGLLWICTGFSACSKKCSQYEIRSTVTRWVGGAVKQTPALLRVDYQYSIPAQNGQNPLYGQVTELAVARTDDTGRFVIRRAPRVSIDRIDMQSMKSSLLYQTKYGSDSMAPSSIQTFVENGVCVFEQNFVVKGTLDTNSDFIKKRIQEEKKLSKEQLRELYVEEK